MFHQVKELPNDSGRPLSYNNFTDKKTKWLLKKQCFFFVCVFCIELSLHLSSFKVRDLQINNSSRHSNLQFACHFVIFWLLQNGAKKNQHQESHQRETVHDKFVMQFLQNWLGKKVNRVSKIRVCMYVSEICVRGIFVSLSLWLENEKSISKIALFFFKWVPF